MSDLRAFYGSIDREAIRAFVDKRTQEDLYLDFKTLADDKTFDRDARRNLAKAISGFANATGGVIVWGVCAKKDQEGIDAAEETKPIENTARAMSDLQSNSARATNPIADGVEHKAILEDEGSKSGYLVTFVPATDGVPRMAKLGEDRYYKRSGDSFLKMEHFEIADMFGRRPHPKLALCCGVKAQARSDTTVCVTLRLGLENTGRGIARFPSLKLDVSKPFVLSSHGLGTVPGLPRHPSRGGFPKLGSFAGGANDVVHAGALLDVTVVEAVFKGYSRDDDTPVVDVTVRYEVAADGVPLREGKHVVTKEDIQTAIKEAMDAWRP